jgi:hypothetical protein
VEEEQVVINTQHVMKISCSALALRVTKNGSAEKKRVFFLKSINGLSYCMNDF